MVCKVQIEPRLQLHAQAQLPHLELHAKALYPTLSYMPGAIKPHLWLHVDQKGDFKTAQKPARTKEAAPPLPALGPRDPRIFFIGVDKFARRVVLQLPDQLV